MNNDRPKVLFDASSCTGGGALQVAASLVDEIVGLQQDKNFSEIHPWLGAVSFRVAPEVMKTLTVEVEKTDITIAELTKWWYPKNWLRSNRNKFDLHLRVFGPLFGAGESAITVVGIADGTSIFPRPTGVPRLPLFSHLKRSLTSWISRKSFGKASFLIAESQAILDQFAARTGFDLENSAVISNVVNQIVLDTDRELPLPSNFLKMKEPGQFLLAYPASFHPHKNHAFLVPLRRELRKYGLNVRFVVTLPDEQWRRLTREFHEACINVGVIPVASIGYLFRRVDAIIFPSLLESFSVTPLEALATNGLLFASDRDFVRETCGNCASYFDPLDPRAAARVIANVIVDNSLVSDYRQCSENLIPTLGTAFLRAKSYVELITKILDRQL